MPVQNQAKYRQRQRLILTHDDAARLVSKDGYGSITSVPPLSTGSCLESDAGQSGTRGVGEPRVNQVNPGDRRRTFVVTRTEKNRECFAISRNVSGLFRLFFGASRCGSVAYRSGISVASTEDRWCRICVIQC